MGLHSQALPVYCGLATRVLGGLASTWIIAHRLSLEDFGILAIAGSLGAFAWTLCDWGVSLRGQRILGARSTNPVRRDTFIRDSIRFRGILFLALGLPLLCAASLHPALAPRDIVLIATALVFGWSNAASPAWSLPILQRNILALPVDIASALGTLACSWWLVHDRTTLPLFFAAPVLANVGLMTWFLTSTSSGARRSRPHLRVWLRHFAPSLGLRTAMTGLSLGVVVLYATVNPPHEIAVYAAADRVLRYAITGLSPIFAISAPWLFAASHASARRHHWFITTYMAIHGALGLAAAGVMALAGPWVVEYVYGERYRESWNAIRWLSPAVFFWMIENAALTQILVARGHDGRATRVVIGTACTTLAIIALGLCDGVSGMVLVTIIIEATLALGGCICLLRSKGSPNVI